MARLQITKTSSGKCVQRLTQDQYDSNGNIVTVPIGPWQPCNTDSKWWGRSGTNTGVVMNDSILIRKPRNLVRGADVSLTANGVFDTPASGTFTTAEKDKLKKLALLVVVFALGWWLFSKL